MYSLPYHTETDPAVVKQFMKDHPFIVLCGSDANNQPVATQIPLLLEEENDKIWLYGHIMKQTDHHKAFVQNPNVLAIFTGPHTYVSASWYTNPLTASTWNYVTVQAKGTIQFLDDDALLDILKKTTDHFENNTQSPSLVEAMPEEYVSRLMKAIVAFRIEITRVDNIFKLSQNRDKKSYHQIIDQLKQQHGDATAIASMMEARSSQLFKE